LDIQAYISSGILELYVLNQLEPEKVQEVEQYAAKYPEVKAEIDAIEKALEKYALLHATPPPVGTLENILKEIEKHPKSGKTNSNGGNTGNTSWMWLLLMAAFAGLIFFWYMWNQESTTRQETQQELNNLRIACNVTDSTNQQLIARLEAIQAPGMNRIELGSTGLVANVKSVVFYNPDNQQAFLHPDNLPKPPSGKQYQLWAIVDGAPVSMGVFDLQDGLEALVEVPFVESPQAFAITLEDAGGVPSPTMDQMYVMGTI
jgi:anti-sigma-K factor RskA